ncbi:MAG: IS4 family transposase, partial [Chloroflexi bacterium]|nr:IS4 family transposase [Chloroflexota bacterium]
MAERLTELIRPITFSTVAFYYDLGLRQRLLTLPIMVALVLTMIWRQVGSVRQLVHLLNTEGLFWAEPTQVSQQAVSQRLRTLPAELFLQVLTTLLPQLQARWRERQRPLPPEIVWAQAHYTEVLVHDGSTLDALLRKVGLLREAETNPLA